MKQLTTLFLIPTLALLAGCGDDHAHPHPHPHPDSGQGGAADPSGGSDDGGDHMHTQAVELGEITIGKSKVKATRRSELAAGKEVEVDLEFTAGEVPSTVRGWIGVESGKGARKERFAKEGDRGMHGHAMAPDPIGPDDRLWIEIEGEGAGSLVLK